jgi:hypothetical protein
LGCFQSPELSLNAASPVPKFNDVVDELTAPSGPAPFRPGPLAPLLVHLYAHVVDSRARSIIDHPFAVAREIFDDKQRVFRLIVIIGESQKTSLTLVQKGADGSKNLHLVDEFLPLQGLAAAAFSLLIHFV